MINVSANTLMHGVSHIVPNHDSKLPLLTDYGREFFKRKSKLYHDAKQRGTLDYYKIFLYNEQQELSKDLSHFLHDDEMAKTHKMNDDDIEGWKKYKEMSDEYSVVSYFLRKK